MTKVIQQPSKDKVGSYIFRELCTYAEKCDAVDCLGYFIVYLTLRMWKGSLEVGVL